jgi:hypothetical protein
MASRRSLPRGGAGASAGRFARVRNAARRMWPVALEAWRRWDQLPPKQKERYKRQASEYAGRGRKALADRRARRGGRR